jgi:predicted DNA-binding ribbon-helix-helix protein
MVQRTTISAEADVLETLRAEAERRGVSFAMLAAEILAEKAAELRRARRPRVGVGRSGTGVSQDSVEKEDLPAAQ